LFIKYVRRFYKQLAILLLALVATVAINSLMLRLFDVQHLFKETIGIPLQQMAAVVAYDGVMTEDENVFMNQVMPLDSIKNQYNPYSADSLKWQGDKINDEFINNHRIEIMKIWISMGSKNPRIYADAYLRATYGFWSVTNDQKEGKVYDGRAESYDDWYTENMLSTRISKLFISLREGSLFWLFMAIIATICLTQKADAFLISAPVLGGWLSIMVATPVAGQFRYTLYIMMAIPLAIGVLMLNNTDRDLTKV
jgi:hypothetical protein